MFEKDILLTDQKAKRRMFKKHRRSSCIGVFLCFIISMFIAIAIVLAKHKSPSPSNATQSAPMYPTAEVVESLDESSLCRLLNTGVDINLLTLEYQNASVSTESVTITTVTQEAGNVILANECGFRMVISLSVDHTISEICMFNATSSFQIVELQYAEDCDDDTMGQARRRLANDSGEYSIDQIINLLIGYNVTTSTITAQFEDGTRFEAGTGECSSICEDASVMDPVTNISAMLCDQIVSDPNSLDPKLIDICLIQSDDFKQCQTLCPVTCAKSDMSEVCTQPESINTTRCLWWDNRGEQSTDDKDGADVNNIWVCRLPKYAICRQDIMVENPEKEIFTCLCEPGFKNMQLEADTDDGDDDGHDGGDHRRRMVSMKRRLTGKGKKDSSMYRKFHPRHKRGKRWKKHKHRKHNDDNDDGYTTTVTPSTTTTTTVTPTTTPPTEIECFPDAPEQKRHKHRRKNNQVQCMQLQADLNISCLGVSSLSTVYAVNNTLNATVRICNAGPDEAEEVELQQTLVTGYQEDGSAPVLEMVDYAVSEPVCAGRGDWSTRSVVRCINQQYFGFGMATP
jgi:hypothetical protein